MSVHPLVQQSPGTSGPGSHSSPGSRMPSPQAAPATWVRSISPMMSATIWTSGRCAIFIPPVVRVYDGMFFSPSGGRERCALTIAAGPGYSHPARNGAERARVPFRRRRAAAPTGRVRVLVHARPRTEPSRGANCDRMNFILDATYAGKYDAVLGRRGVRFTMEQARRFVTPTGKARMWQYCRAPDYSRPEKIIAGIRALGVDTTAWET